MHIHKEPARRTSYKGEVANRHEADDLTPAAGDSAIVIRARNRSFVICCPDGCGEHLTINLDERAGAAWSLYRSARGVTLYPSVWRENGCKSHFIIWHNAILWCDSYSEGNREPEDLNPGLRERVIAILDEDWRSYRAVAMQLDEIPWEVSRACRDLIQQGLVEEGDDAFRGHYRRRQAGGPNPHNPDLDPSAAPR
ncbi:DUF6527 family protein [uncultured Rhodoblastus sp.]|uniref:DUF6527 family protein n=1 Tax=uncultured Rhodoblastus sp. TaxID=543037 RepID=UPI0025E8A815|nr:DUF6527 family protein [uncultured Rhodoblastus sp.]